MLNLKNRENNLSGLVFSFTSSNFEREYAIVLLFEIFQKSLESTYINKS